MTPWVTALGHLLGGRKPPRKPMPVDALGDSEAPSRVFDSVDLGRRIADLADLPTLLALGQVNRVLRDIRAQVLRAPRSAENVWRRTFPQQLHRFSLPEMIGATLNRYQRAAVHLRTRQVTVHALGTTTGEVTHVGSSGSSGNLFAVVQRPNGNHAVNRWANPRESQRGVLLSHDQEIASGYTLGMGRNNDILWTGFTRVGTLRCVGTFESYVVDHTAPASQRELVHRNPQVAVHPLTEALCTYNATCLKLWSQAGVGRQSPRAILEAPPTSPWEAAAWTADGAALYCAQRSGDATVITRRHKDSLHVVAREVLTLRCSVLNLAPSPDGNLLAVLTRKRGLVMMSLTGPRPPVRCRHMPCDLLRLAWSADSHFVAASARYEVVIWSAQRGHRVFKSRTRSQQTSLAFASDVSYLAVGTRSDGVVLYDFHT